jgi:uncharacterized protein (TIGR00369 family)
MKRIVNPFVGSKDYNCFACCSENECGLKMQFVEEGEEVVSRWTPETRFEGYTGVLHGGIQSTLMDELASWFIFARMGTAGATSRLEVDFLSPVYIGRGDITLRGRLGEVKENLVTVEVSLRDGDQKECAVGRVTYFTYPERLARRRLRYPGREHFYDESASP